MSKTEIQRSSGIMSDLQKLSRNGLFIALLAFGKLGIADGINPENAQAANAVGDVNMQDLNQKLAEKKARLNSKIVKDKTEIEKLQKEINEIQARIDARNKKLEASMQDLTNTLAAYK